MVKTEQTVFRSPKMMSWRGSSDWSGTYGPDGVLIADWVIFGRPWFPGNEQTAGGF